jgi:hypothetical protein
MVVRNPTAGAGFVSLVHGREITAEQVELIVGREFPVQRFVSMSNAIIWALSRPLGLT